MKIIIPFLSCFCVLWFGSGCQKKITQQVEIDRRTTEYYEALGSNLERLNALHSGLFVHYYQSEDSLKRWETQSSNDSILVYVRPVGNPHRDGYWLVSQQFIASLPEEPLASYLLYSEAISRDTFAMWLVSMPEAPKLKALVSDTFTLGRKVNLARLRPTNVEDAVYLFTRQDMTHYEFMSAAMSVANLAAADSIDHMRMRMNLAPEGLKITSFMYMSDSTKASESVNFFRRCTERQYATFKGQWLN